jgi:hypothetical protein
MLGFSGRRGGSLLLVGRQDTPLRKEKQDFLPNFKLYI